MIANSSSLSLPGLLSTSIGIAALPRSCNSPRFRRNASALVEPSCLASAIISAQTATECM
jgi:hypothetical protein